MFIGLNPIMGSDIIFGQNDSFVLAWIVLSLWLWTRGAGSRRDAWYLASAAAFAWHAPASQRHGFLRLSTCC